MAELRNRGWVTRRQINPMELNIHHLNRGGVVGNSSNLTRLVDNIVEMNFAWKECEHALCMKVEPEDKESENAYRTWCEESTVDLPKVPAGSTSYSTLACGHTNTSLRAIQQECRSTHPILSDGTRYNMDNVRRKDPKFAEAATSGIWWWVLEAHVLQKYPAIIRIFDASRNASTHVATPESEITGMNKLFMMWSKDEKAGVSGSYFAYVAVVLRSRPPWGNDCKHYVPFLQSHAGGDKEANWSEFQTRHSHTVASATRKMDGKIFRLLATATDTVLVYASLYAAYLCPEDTLVNGFCVWITAADFGKIIVVHKAGDDAKKKAEKDAAIKKNNAASAYLTAVEKLFKADGPMQTAVKADAKVSPGIPGAQNEYEAKRTAGQQCRSLLNKIICCIGRYVCGKPQEDGFGKATAEELNDIHVYLMASLQGQFAGSVTPEMTKDITDLGRALPTTTEQKPEKKKKPVTAVAAVVDLGKMPTLRKGPKEVLNDLGFQVGCNVNSRGGIRGVYKILEIRKATAKQPSGTVVLTLVAKLVSMEELWEMIEVTAGRSPIKAAVAEETAPAVKPAGAAPTGTPVEDAPVAKAAGAASTDTPVGDAPALSRKR
jgi:hypothetical protein